VPAVLAGLLGLFPHAAPEGADYVPRLRGMLVGAAALGYLGPGVFFWRRAKGWKRWGALLLGLAAVRVLYVPVVAVAFVLVGWLEWGARTAGAGSFGGPLHYGFACLVAAFTSLAVLTVVAAAGNVAKPKWIVPLLLFLGAGVLAFWHPEDRTVLPHPFAKDGPSPASRGPEYLDVAEDGERSWHVRVLAAFGGIRHALSARSGWGGAVREEMLARYRSKPGQSLRDRMLSLEAALDVARPLLTTSE